MTLAESIAALTLHEPATTIEALDIDVLAHILMQLPPDDGLAREVARTAPVCRAFCDAARHASVSPHFDNVVVLEDKLVCKVLVSPDGQIVTRRPVDNTFKVWHGAMCTHTAQAGPRTTDSISSWAVLPGGKRFVSIGTADSKTAAKVWNYDGSLASMFEVKHAKSLVAMPDGEHIAIGLKPLTLDLVERHARIRLFKLDGAVTDTFFLPGASTWDLCMAENLLVTPDGMNLIAWPFFHDDSKCDIRVFNVASKSLVRGARWGSENGVETIAAMPDGQRLLVSPRDGAGIHGGTGRVYTWLLLTGISGSFEPHAGRIECTSELHALQVNAIVALPDNQRALSASKDKTVKLFNVDNGAILRSFTHHNEPVWHIALMPDGCRFISVAGLDRNKAGKIMRTEAPQEDLTQEEQEEMWEDFTDDGGRTRFSTVGLHGTACIVDLGGA